VDLRKSIRKPLFVLILLGICSVWALLSQVSMLRLPNSEKFLGPDGLLAFLENPTIDARFRLRGPIEAPVKVAYVDVDSESISRLGNFPWNREFFALALDALFEFGGIRAAGMDFVFSSAGIPALGREEAQKGTIALGKCIHKNKNVVLAATYGSQNRPLGDSSSFPFVFERRYGTTPIGPPELPSHPVVGPTWGRIGLIDTVGEDVRYVPYFAKTDLHTYYPMSLQLALILWKLGPQDVTIESNRVVVKKTTTPRLSPSPLSWANSSSSIGSTVGFPRPTTTPALSMSSLTATPPGTAHRRKKNSPANFSNPFTTASC
jgi:adenylate cyclase